MRTRATTLIGAALLICLMPAAGQAALTAYSQNFETLVQADPGALGADGWLVFGNCYQPDGVTYLYGYGTFPAPNHALAFSAIAVLEGGVPQGAQQLSVFSDYENGDHGVGNIIESNVFQEQIIGPENIGQQWVFEFEAKLGNLTGASTATAFIKTLNPAAGFATTNLVSLDMTTTPAVWTGYSLELFIDPSLVGQYFQIGFSNRATNYVSSGVFYDNISFSRVLTGTPPNELAVGATLGQNYPNPFNPETRIEFSLERPGNVKITVFDLAGRKIATLHDRELGVGEHFVNWNGRTDGGVAVASGRYNYVMETASGRVSRSMTLLK
jgi:hypothetical protein